MYYLYHRDGDKILFQCETAKEFDQYIKDNIHETNYYEFIQYRNKSVTPLGNK